MRGPSFIQIEVSAECNLRCVMCAIRYRTDHRAGGGKALMALGTYRSIIDQCGGVRRVHLQGLGEPLIHPDFFGMVRYAAERSMAVTVNTNLLLLDKRTAAEMAESGLEEICVSVDGARKETYENIRVNGDFDLLKRNLGYLKKAVSPAPKLYFVVVLMNQNVRELPRIVELAGRYGVNAVSVQHLCHNFSEPGLPAHYLPMRKAFRRQSPFFAGTANVEYIFEQTRRAAEKAGVGLRLPKTKPAGNGEPEGCEWPWKGMYITWDGAAMPCCMLSSADRMNFGRVSSGDALAELWNGPVYKDFRASMLRRAPPPVCVNCAMYRGMF